MPNLTTCTWIVILDGCETNFFLCLLGCLGGVLFEYYVIIYGSKIDSEHVLAVLTKKKKISEYKIDHLVRKYRSFFWLFAAISMYRVNRYCSMPLLHFTIQQEYRGLSRIGRALPAAYGGSPSVQNYDEKKRALVEGRNGQG